jgi:hypothetical protein
MLPPVVSADEHDKGQRDERRLDIFGEGLHRRIIPETRYEWSGAVVRGRRAMLARFAGLWIPSRPRQSAGSDCTKPPFGIGPDGGFVSNT